MNVEKKRAMKVFSYILIGLFISVLVSQIVSAQIDPVKVETKAGQIIYSAISIIKPFFNILLNLEPGTKLGGDDVMKILAFSMVLIIIYGLLETIKIINIEDKEGLSTFLNFLLGVIVSTIGIRFLPPNLLSALTAPSSAFVLMIFFGLPFVFTYFLLKDKPNYMQRTAWIIYFILMIIVVIYNYITNIPGYQTFYWVYNVFAAAALFMAWFGGHVSDIVELGKEERAIAKSGVLRLSKLRNKLSEIRDQIANSGDSGLSEAQINSLTEEQKRLEKLLDAVISEGNKDTRSLKKKWWWLSGLLVLISFIIALGLLVWFLSK